MRYLLHCIAAGFALLALTLSALYVVPTITAQIESKRTVFTVQTNTGATIGINVTEKQSGAYIALENKNNFTVTFHAPKQLIPKSAKNTTVAASTLPTNSREYASYSLAPMSSIYLEGAVNTNSMIVYNTTLQPLLVEYSRVNILDDSTLRDSQLIVSKKGTLW